MDKQEAGAIKESTQTNERKARENGLTWRSHEYFTAKRSAKWFILLVLVVAVLVTLSIWLLESWTFAALIVVSAAAIIVYIKRPPQLLDYSLTDTGVFIGNSFRPFEDFKAFGVLKDGAHFSIILIPRKRFGQSVTVYFPEGLGERIVDEFGARLPMQEVKLDLIDRIVRSLKIQ